MRVLDGARERDREWRVAQEDAPRQRAIHQRDMAMKSAKNKRRPESVVAAMRDGGGEYVICSCRALRRRGDMRRGPARSNRRRCRVTSTICHDKRRIAVAAALRALLVRRKEMLCDGERPA